MKTIDEIKEIRSNLEAKKVKKLNLDLLERITLRIQDFSPECETCEKNKARIDEMLNILKNHNDQKALKEYKTSLRALINHLQKEHKLVEEGSYTSQWIALGVVFGTAIDTAFVISSSSFLGFGTTIGLLIGTVIGSNMDAKAKKEGRTI